MMPPRCRFIGRYGTYRVGEVISPPASLRKLLLDRKLIEVLEEVAVAVKTDERKRPAKRKKK